MDKTPVSLSLAFLRSRPEAAAKTLESLPREDVSKFLSEIPIELASLVLSKLLPRQASKHLATFETEKAAAILAPLEASSIAAILRLTDATNQKLLLEALPKERRSACQTILRYDEDLVGAWANYDCICLHSDLTAQQARESMPPYSNASCQDLLFVVNRDNRFIGEIPTLALLSAPDSRPLKDLARQRTPWLAARTSLETAAESQLWRDRDIMPILNANQHFVGALKHCALREALSHDRVKEDSGATHQLAPTLIEDYAKVLWELGMSLIGEYDSKKQAPSHPPS